MKKILLIFTSCCFATFLHSQNTQRVSQEKQNADISAKKNAQLIIDAELKKSKEIKNQPTQILDEGGRIIKTEINSKKIVSTEKKIADKLAKEKAQKEIDEKLADYSIKKANALTKERNQLIKDVKKLSNNDVELTKKVVARIDSLYSSAKSVRSDNVYNTLSKTNSNKYVSVSQVLTIINSIQK